MSPANFNVKFNAVQTHLFRCLPWLSVLAYPLAILAILNLSVFDSRDIVIIGIWFIGFYALASLLKQAWILLVGIGVLVLDAGLNLFHIVVLHGPLSANSLFVVANTNSGEAGDFIQFKSSFDYWYIIPFFSLLFWAIRVSSTTPLQFWNKKIAWLGLIIPFIFLGENIYHNRFVRKATPPATRALVSFVETQQLFLTQTPRVRHQVSNTFSTNENDVVVLIVGESLTRRHMQLYGYNRPTNPLLRQRNDILVYNRAVSPYTHTLTALLSAFTTSNIDNQQAYDSALSIIDVYASAGYKTYWLSNQSPAGLWDNAIYRLAQTAHQSVFINRLGNSSFDATLQASYDEALLPELSKALNDSANKKLIVLHLMGNHSLYEKRYPASFTYFPLDKDKKQNTINAYDNAVRYNDYVMNCLFDTMTQRAQQHPHISYAACYWSDHGENVYDENNAVGHDYTGLVPWTQIEVPFMIWCSAKHPLNERLQHGVWAQQKNNVFMTDDLFHTFLDAAGIRTAAFDSTRSIFNTHFNSSRPARLEDGNVYR
jgi:heptose-I-phosphate ethanolaminephosphotransferase